MKICARCEDELDDSAFYRRSSTKCGLSSWCKDCTRTYENERYGEEYRREQIRLRTQQAVQLKQAKLWQYLLDHPCLDCGERDPLVLEFDHRDPRQSKCVTSMISNSVSWKRILAEIELCDVVCANCHSRRTAARADSWRSRRAACGRSVYTNAAQLLAGLLPALPDIPGRAVYMKPVRVGEGT